MCVFGATGKDLDADYGLELLSYLVRFTFTPSLTVNRAHAVLERAC